MYVRQIYGLQKVFFCDFCGFQCVEENLLNVYYFGKIYFRRQNFVVRGGFVQILIKQFFFKKLCIMGIKNIYVKLRGFKLMVKNSDLKGLRNVGSKF